MNDRSAVNRRRALLAVTVIGIAVSSAAALADQSRTSDRDELRSLVFEYTRLEDAGDMASQSRMMAADRVWHGLGGRRTDNALYMKMQEQANANARKRYPGVTVMREARDVEIRLLAPTVALTSFTWFSNRLIPPDLPADKVQALGPAPIPQTVSMVWVRQQDGWKIASTHISPQYLRP